MNWKQLSGTGLNSPHGFCVLSSLADRACVGWFQAATVIVLVLATCSNAAWAQSSANPRFSLGVGIDNVLGSIIDERPGSPLPYVSVEVASARLTERVDLRLASGADISPYGGWFGSGASISLGLPDTSMFVEASFMPGLWVDFDHQYRVGAFEQGLGHPLEFRSQIGVGWQIDPVSAVLLTLSHKSNGNIPGGVANPGMEALQVRYSQSF